MAKTVICSDCGKKFLVRDDEGDFYPPDCPGCDKTILSVTPTPTSEEFSAQVEE